jgi:hypothetical protein
MTAAHEACVQAWRLMSTAVAAAGAGHSHAPRVRPLLEADTQACQSQSFMPVDDGPVTLDVVLRCRVTPGRPLRNPSLSIHNLQ